MEAASRWDAVCIGHSHSAAVAQAAQAGGIDLEVLNFWHLPGAIVRDDGPIHFAPHVHARLRAPVFSLIGGAVHYDVGLLLHATPFDFIDPAAPDEGLVPGAALIPYGAIRAALQTRTRPYLEIMDLVRDAVPGPVFHLQSPPVHEDEQIQEHDPGWVAFYGTGRTIAPAAFRRKLWRLHSSIVAEHCTARRIVFVPCPPAAFNAAGYLRAGLSGKPAHANAAYGALVIEQIAALLAAVPNPVPAPGPAPVPTPGHGSRGLRLWQRFGKTARLPPAPDQVPDQVKP